MKFLAILALCLAGCAHTTYTHGVPNLAKVGPGIWRSGQPVTPEAWAYLRSIGVRVVVKLDMPDEGSDDGARALGLEVHELSIEPAGDKDVFSQVARTFVEPDASLVDESVRLIVRGGGVLVHCSHGQDRTGTVVGAYRVRALGWSKRAAWAEAIALGFHPELVGLVDFWDERIP